jgi:hypothetical protein
MFSQKCYRGLKLKISRKWCWKLKLCIIDVIEAKIKMYDIVYHVLL